VNERRCDVNVIIKSGFTTRSKPDHAIEKSSRFELLVSESMWLELVSGNC